jgi:integrase
MDQAPLGPALTKAGIPYQRPYDLRHSFASLLLHEGRSVIHVARQLGDSAAVLMRTYGQVSEELDEAPSLGAEDAIRAARAIADGRKMDASGGRA